MSKSKYIVCSIIFILSLSIANGQGRNDWSSSSNCQEKKIEKEAKDLAKQYKKDQKLTPDLDIGSAERQITNRLEMECQEFKVSATSRYAQPRFTFEQGKGNHDVLAEAVIIARKNAVQALKENSGGTFAGMIKDEEGFVNKDGVNIKEDLSSTVIKELVQGELDRNKVITQFYKRERNGTHSVSMVIAIDNSTVIKKIQQTSKDDLDKLLGLNE